MGGLSINEAMLFGKPVICSVCDGTEKKLVRDGFNGYFFENGNLISLKEKISLLLSDKNKIDEFGKNSVSIIKDEVNIHTVVAGYLNAFTNILNNLA
jgi:glycosyltransferase involved in cell wall biosynthesis